jgi:hypothetical protein
VTTAPPRIALVGDLHAAWDDADAAYFGSSDYHKVLVTGDLGNSGQANGVKIAQSLSRIAKDTLVMPGNNDVRDYAAIVALTSPKDWTQSQKQMMTVARKVYGLRTALVCALAVLLISAAGLINREIAQAQQRERVKGLVDQLLVAEIGCANVNAAYCLRELMYRRPQPVRGLPSNAATNGKPVSTTLALPPAMLNFLSRPFSST